MFLVYLLMPLSGSFALSPSPPSQKSLQPPPPPPLLFPLHYVLLTSPGIKNNSLVPPNSPSQQFKTILLNNDNHSISLFHLQQPPVPFKVSRPRSQAPPLGLDKSSPSLNSDKSPHRPAFVVYSLFEIQHAAMCLDASLSTSAY